MSTIATAYLQLVPTMKGTQSNLAKELTDSAAPAGEKAGLASGSRFSKGLALGLGAAAAAIGGAVAATKGIYEIGKTFTEVGNNIRVGTGASGEALKSLEDSARRVGTSVPTDFHSAGTAIADLNTRMGLTGPVLEKVASQYLEAGRILGEDVDVNTTSAAFNAFKIEGEDVSTAMDQLFQVSQATGVGMNELASAVQSNAPALQELGFSFKDTTALVGILDKAGLNSTKMMAGMSRALIELAKDGEEPSEAFQRVTAEMEDLLKSGDRAAAIDLASTLFGTRNASQFIGALDSGTLSIKDLMSAAGATEDTILGLGKETMTASEHWQVFKNNATASLEPVGRVFHKTFGDILGVISGLAQKHGPALGEALGRIMDKVGPAVGTVVKLFGDFGPILGDLLSEVIPLVTSFSPLKIILEALRPVLPTLVKAVKNLASALGGALQTVLPVVVTILQTLAKVLSGALMAVMPIIVKVIATLADTLSGLLEAIMPVVGALLDALVPIIVTLIGVIAPLVEAVLPVLSALFSALVPVITPLVKILSSVLTPVINVLGGVLKWLAENIIATVIKWITSVIKWFSNFSANVKTVWRAVQDAGKAAWEFIDKKVFSPLKKGLKLLEDGFTAARKWIGEAWEKIKSAGKTAWDFVDKWVLSPFKTGLRLLRDAFTNVKSGIKTVWESLKEVLAAPWRWIRDNVFTKLKAGVKLIPKAFETAKTSIKKVWDGIKAVAAKPINFVIDTVYNKGIKAAVDKIAGFLKLSLTLPTAKTVNFARGTEDHRAQIAGAGAMRVWAEPETGGEAYIPLSSAKRQRSTKILGQVASRFGYGLMPYAKGGFWNGVGDFFTGAWDLAKDIGAFVANPREGVKNLVRAPMEAALQGIGGHGFAQLMAGIPRRLTAGIIQDAKRIFQIDKIVGDGKWVRPSKGIVTSTFGQRWGTLHSGVDFAGGGATYAAQGGKVVDVGWNIVPYMTGIGILLDHLNGWRSYYGHNPSMSAVKVRPGQFVKAGQHIGWEGSTGNSTGDHLHFTVWKNGSLVNPKSLGIFDQGGWLEPGAMAINKTTKPEPVFTSSQWQTLSTGPSPRERRDDLDYLADRIVRGLEDMARGAGAANDLVRHGRLRARMNGA